MLKKINWQNILIFIGSVVLIAFVFSGIYFFTISQTRPERGFSWRDIYLTQTIFYSWAILFPFILYLAKRFPCERNNWLRILPVHLLGTFVFLFLHAVIYVSFNYLIDPTILNSENFFRLTLRLFAAALLIDLPMYWLILSILFTRDYYQRLQREQVKSSELQTALVNSQLKALKMQLHPHFLFNTLNSISTLIHEDTRAADQMVVRLGNFLRLTLENSGELEVSLREELNFVSCYLEIETIRFQDRLTIEKEIEPETLEASVPNLILQPIIENAIRHGISRQKGAGRIIIRAWRIDDNLLLQVEDSGPGIKNVDGDGSEATSGGIGLANTRTRLSHLYGYDYRLECKNAAPRGFIVTLEIPFRKLESRKNLKLKKSHERIADQSFNCG